MRALVFIVSLFSLLLRGEHTVFENASPVYSLSTENSKNLHVKSSNQEAAFSISEYADLDPSEDYHSGNDITDDSATTLFGGSYHISYQWYLAIAGLLLLTFIRRNFQATPVLRASSSPIYITQRDLRI
ncbi:hypothetical protein [Flavobacterium silvaticum]|uniref:Uncharacterized protein n=1 Tax=Flavobacterium silvaticum TaxID=1852020 RepID=A0A972FR75_9FLAO|nr:hypothetical protein [Flavobacterium silvaticum]NMH27008.1 hypothetical protein [Flavobacterium silvaticum]